MPIIDPSRLIKSVVREEGGFSNFPVLTDGMRPNTVQNSDTTETENEFFASMETYERWFLWGFSSWASDSEGNSDLVKE